MLRVPNWYRVPRSDEVVDIVSTDISNVISRMAMAIKTAFSQNIIKCMSTLRTVLNYQLINQSNSSFISSNQQYKFHSYKMQHLLQYVKINNKMLVESE